MEDVRQTETAAPAAQPAQQTLTEAVNSGQLPSARTFTQAELDHHAGERAKRAAESAVKKILGKLGLASEDDIDPLKTTIADAQKKADAEKTEVQRLSDQTAKKDEMIAQLQKQITDMTETRKSDLVEGAIRTAATASKANNPKTVLSYIRDNHKAAMREAVNDDGTIDDKKIAALIETVKKDDPTLFTVVIPGAGSPSNSGGRVAPQPVKPDLKFRI